MVKLKDRLPDLLAVVEMASTVMSVDAAESWLRSPNLGLDYERPLDLVEAGDTQRVINLLLVLAEGVTT